MAARPAGGEQPTAGIDAYFKILGPGGRSPTSRLRQPVGRPAPASSPFARALAGRPSIRCCLDEPRGRGLDVTESRLAGAGGLRAISRRRAPPSSWSTTTWDSSSTCATGSWC